MKKLFAALTMVMVLTFSVPAMATWGDCPQGQERKGWKCVDIEVPQLGNHNSNSNENKNYNTNFNTNLNSNTNLNTNKNINKNKNINTNINGQGQDQSQGQLQGQAQLQGQGQSQNAEANNSGNVQDTEVIIGGDTYEAEPNHIQGPAILQPDAKFSDAKEFSFRLLGSVWADVTGLSSSQARNLGIDVVDVKIDRALLTSMSAQKYIAKGKPADGVMLGTLYVYPIGEGVTVAGIEGKAAESAMGYGATHAVIFYDFGIETYGSAWNIGLGGGASMVANSSGSVMVAPNGGLGYGKAKASNVSLPALVVKLYRNELSAKANEVK